jgi:uncharacterized protein YqfA (UPF0365 family)
MDLYRMRNIESDTKMRGAIGGESAPAGEGERGS